MSCSLFTDPVENRDKCTKDAEAALQSIYGFLIPGKIMLLLNGWFVFYLMNTVLELTLFSSLFWLLKLKAKCVVPT